MTIEDFNARYISCGCSLALSIIGGTKTGELTLTIDGNPIKSPPTLIDLADIPYFSEVPESLVEIVIGIVG
jgi:hypothetical protein